MSQKELEKSLHALNPAELPDLKKVKARIEIIADFETLKKIASLLQELSC